MKNYTIKFFTMVAIIIAVCSLLSMPVKAEDEEIPKIQITQTGDENNPEFFHLSLMPKELYKQETKGSIQKGLNDKVAVYIPDHDVFDCKVMIVIHGGMDVFTDYFKEEFLSLYDQTGPYVVCSIDYKKWNDIRIFDYDAVALRIIDSVLPYLADLGANIERSNISIIGNSQGGQYVSGMMPQLIPYIYNFGIMSWAAESEEIAEALDKYNEEFDTRVYYCACARESWDLMQACNVVYPHLKTENCRFDKTLYEHDWRTWKIGLTNFLLWNQETETLTDANCILKGVL